MKIEDDNFSVGKGWSLISDRSEWTDGEVVTPHGIVSVYAQGDLIYEKVTRLDFVWKGRMYRRSFRKKRYTSRGIVTKAKAFAKEIADA